MPGFDKLTHELTGLAVEQQHVVTPEGRNVQDEIDNAIAVGVSQGRGRAADPVTVGLTLRWVSIP